MIHLAGVDVGGLFVTIATRQHIILRFKEQEPPSISKPVPQH